MSTWIREREPQVLPNPRFEAPDTYAHEPRPEDAVADVRADGNPLPWTSEVGVDVRGGPRPSVSTFGPW